jgi:hypothetical protein
MNKLIDDFDNRYEYTKHFFDENLPLYISNTPCLKTYDALEKMNERRNLFN